MSKEPTSAGTVSILYCARCAGEQLEQPEPGVLVCPDCGNVARYDPQQLRIGRLAGTKYKRRNKQTYSFREIVDAGREDAFREKYIPSPEPIQRRKGERRWQRRLDGAAHGNNGRLPESNGSDAPGVRRLADEFEEETIEEDDERDDSCERGSC